MAFARKSGFAIRNSKMVIRPEQELQYGPAIEQFLGQSKTSNILKMLPGQLLQNKNLEWVGAQGQDYLSTKRGSTLIADITQRSYGAGMYIYNLATEYHTWVDANGVLKTMPSGGGTVSELKTGVSVASQNRFAMFGLNTLSVLFGCNEADGVYKVSGSTPTHGTVTSPAALTDICYSRKAGRMFGVYQHTQYWTELQSSSANITNISNWAVGTNNQQIGEDGGSGFKRVLEVNEIVCGFKDTVIWGLLNPNNAVNSWVYAILSNEGTKSPDTVQLGTYGTQGTEGAIYLDSRKKLRFFQPIVALNADSTPSVQKRSSYDIGRHFQNILDEIPTAKLSQCKGRFYNGLYIFNCFSASSSILDTTIILDTTRLLPKQKGDEIPQCYWYSSTNMNYVDFTYSELNQVLYGFDQQGFVAQLFVKDKFYEEIPSRVTVSETTEALNGSTNKVEIDPEMFVAWRKFSENLLVLKSLNIYWEPNGVFDLTVYVNSFRTGENIPDYDAGTSGTLTPALRGLSIWDVSLWDADQWSGDQNAISQNKSISKKGHYFTFGLSTASMNAQIKVTKIEPIFEVIRNDIRGYRE